jgi:phosphonoacetaldehyde hydrolase
MKIDDSILGIEEGKNAGCITVGVARWSIHMNIMSLKDSYEIGESEIREKLKHSRNVLREGGADYVIDTLEELPRVIESINYK